MYLRSQPHYWYARFLGGILLIILGGFAGFRAPLAMLAGLTGFMIAFTSITPVVRMLTRQVRANSTWTTAATQAFARASLPRRIYYLLAAVAEADGPMTAAERQTVRHFVLDRFSDPIQAQEIRQWEEQPLRVTDPTGLAARIATGLDESELDTLFTWCCLVTFADGKFVATEHAVLQQVAMGLGIHSSRARMLFHVVRAQFLRGDKKGHTTRPTQQVDHRAQALTVLGLPPNAEPELIRRRHRELVKRFHPDAHNQLGPVAQREATERFHEIQRAYETLQTS